MLRLVLFALYVILASFGLYKLKMSSRFFDLNFILGFAGYASSFVTWLFILRLTPLSVAFPIISGILIVATQLIGVFLLNEHISPMGIAGTFLVLGGICLIYAC